MISPELIDQEFKPTPGNKFKYAFIVMILLGMSFLIISAPSRWESTFKLVALPVLYLLAFFGLLKAFSRKLIISKSSIVYTTFFRTRELAIKDVKGFRKGVRYVKLESKNAGAQAITIDYSDLTQSNDLMQWIKGNFIDLDAIDLAEEKLAFEQDSNGNIDPQNMKQLENAEMVASVYNVISGVTVFIGLISLNTITDSIKLIVPIAWLAIMLLSRKMIRFTPAWGKSIYPSVGVGIVMPCVFLFLNMAVHYNWLNAGKLFIYACLLALAFSWLVYKFGWNKLVAPKWTQVFFIVLAAIFFAPGAVITLNCSFDLSKGKMYYSQVLEKHYTSGNGPNYHLLIAPWQEGNSAKEINVNSSLYAQTGEGQTIEVTERSGLLGIHWFTVKMPEDNLIVPKQ